MAARRGPSGCFVGIMAVFGAFLALLAGVASFVSENRAAFGLVALLLVAGLIGFGVWRYVQRRRLDAYWAAAVSLAKDKRASTASARKVLDLRAKLGRVPPHIEPELGKLYRDAVSAVVADKKVERAERAHLDVVRKGLSISPEVARQAEVLGFLEAHAALVGDGRLTEDEEGLLTDLREALHVPADAVQAQLARIDELREARIIGKSELRPIETNLRLKKSEACYHSTEFVEKKARVARSYQVDGVRHRDMELADERSGTLCVTNERILLIAQGTTTIKLRSVIDAAISPNENLLVLTVDGRKTPHYLAVDRPFVTAAFIEKAASTHDS